MRVSALAFFAMLLFLSVSLHAQQRHWVYLSDRGENAQSRLAEYIADGARVSDAAARRDATIEDLPPYPAYVAAIEASGATVVLRSRWLNAVSVNASQAVLTRIAHLPFVVAIAPVRTWQESALLPAPLASLPPPLSSYGLDYGESLTQLELMRVPLVHDIWIDGTDITVGMLDNGFRWRPHEAMRELKVRDEYDFIFGDTLTENEDVDVSGQDAHGTVTFSTLGGFKQGQLIGPAFNADFYLAKTEKNGSETQIEEDYWVMGIEWLESHGASIVSASLAYSIWDDGTGYHWEDGDYDGRTAVTTRAAVEAMRRGIVLVTAMGNDGSGAHTLLAPSDADSIISVGAVDFSRNVAGFSSRGPTSDQRIKPDVCAPGISVYCANKSGEDTYERNNGTSLATPLVAGIAALVRSARPELTAVQVRDALRNTADNADTPDNIRGWGIVDAWDALLYNGMVISTNPKIFWDGQQSMIMTWVVSMSPVQSDNVTLAWVHPTEGAREEKMKLITPLGIAADGSGLYTASIAGVPENTELRFHIAAADSREARTSPYGAPVRSHRFTVGESRTLGAENLLPADFALHQNYPNPYEPSETEGTIIRYEVPMPGGIVRLELFDALGRRVQTLVDDFRGAGMHAVQFSAFLPSGIYYYALSSGDRQMMRRMLILQ